jgi:hypothetical protein
LSSIVFWDDRHEVGEQMDRWYGDDYWVYGARNWEYDELLQARDSIIYLLEQSLDNDHVLMKDVNDYWYLAEVNQLQGEIAVGYLTVERTYRNVSQD